MNVLRQAETYLQSPVLPGKISDAQSQALAFLKEHGLPKRTQEDWHYTSTKELGQATYAPFAEASIDAGLWTTRAQEVRVASAHNLFFVNDLYLPTISDSCAELQINAAAPGQAWRADLSAYDGMQALADVFQRHTVSFEIFRSLKRPLFIHVFAMNPQELASVSTLRWKLHVREGVEADIVVQNYPVLGSRHFQMMNLQVEAQANSVLNLVTTRESHSLLTWFSEMHLRLEAQARVQALQFFGGEGWFRNNVAAELVGAGADLSLQGLSYCRKDAHCDHFLTVHHKVGETLSSQKYKGLLDQGAKTIFTGKVRIDHDAQKSSAAQLAKFLALDDKSEFNARPILEIHADDVKANHGASTGVLDPEELFYLRSRGLAEPVAQRLLKEAFLADLLETIPPGLLQTQVRNILQNYFTDAKGG